MICVQMTPEHFFDDLASREDAAGVELGLQRQSSKEQHWLRVGFPDFDLSAHLCVVFRSGKGPFCP